MALALIAIDARSQWRIRAFFAGGDPSGQPASAFTLARADGGANTIKIVNAFTPDMGQRELVTSEPLSIGTLYAITWSGNTLTCVFNVAPDDPMFAPDADDPEAEVFGVDLDWIFGQPTADGDCPRRTGQECLVHDLAARVELKKGELVHLPTKGANIKQDTNGPAAPADLLATQATLDAEFRDDDRVADLAITVEESDSQGGFNYDARIVPVAIGGSLKVSNT
jgi:hypothetical protein